MLEIAPKVNAIYVRSDYTDGFMRFTLGDVTTGKILADRFFIKIGSKSVAAFLGIAKALEIIHGFRAYSEFFVQSDDQQAVEWMELNECSFSSKDPHLQELLSDTEQWLKEMNSKTKVEFFDVWKEFKG